MSSTYPAKVRIRYGVYRRVAGKLQFETGCLDIDREWDERKDYMRIREAICEKHPESRVSFWLLAERRPAANGFAKSSADSFAEVA